MNMGTYTIDGIALDDPAGRWAVSDATTLAALPTPTISQVSIPGAHGSVPSAARERGPGSQGIGLIVTDNDMAGKPTGDHQQMRANLAALYALAAPLGRLPILRYSNGPEVVNLTTSPIPTGFVVPGRGAGYSIDYFAGDVNGSVVPAAGDGPVVNGIALGYVRRTIKNTTSALNRFVWAFTRKNADVNGALPNAGDLLPIVPGHTYRITHYARVVSATSWTAPTLGMVVRFFDVAGDWGVSVGTFIPPTPITIGSWQRHTATFTAPPGAYGVAIRQNFSATNSGNFAAVGDTSDVTGLTITDVTGSVATDAGNFDGDTSPTAAHAFVWDGVPNASTSRRVARSARSASVRLLGGVAPEMSDPYTATLVLPFDIPSTFWRDVTEVTSASVATSTWVASPPELNGSTGAITDPVFLCTGPLTKVVVTDATSGKTLEWSGALTAGQVLRLHPATLEAYRTPTEAWTGGINVSGGLSTGFGGFDLNPNTALSVGWTVTRSGGAGVNRSRTRRAFL